jgi:hypothetical protein
VKDGSEDVIGKEKREQQTSAHGGGAHQQHRDLEGAGFLVRRPFPKPAFSEFDPFLLLDEYAEGPRLLDRLPGERLMRSTSLFWQSVDPCDKHTLALLGGAARREYCF